jgi:hypothetical protein
MKEQQAENAKRQAETDRQMKEQQAENAKRQAETDKQMQETDKRIKELGKKIDATNVSINGITKSIGDAAEETIYYALNKNKNFAGIQFHRIDENRRRFSKNLGRRVEYDILMENSDTIAIIETKHKVRVADVTELYTEKVTAFRELFDEYNGYKLILGISGMSFEAKAEKEAEDNGIGIIRVTGDIVEYQTDNVKIIPPVENYSRQ